jgi:replicative DNA helicase
MLMVEVLDEVRRRRERSGRGRVPPNDLDAEESLLGAMLLSTDAIDDALETLDPSDFYKPAHGHVFEAIRDLNVRGEPADPVTVADELRRANLLEAVGGESVLVSLQAGTPATTNASRYARIVRDHAVLRRLIGVAGEIAELGYSLPDDVPSAVDTAESMVFALAENGASEGLEPLSQILDESVNQIEHRYANPDELKGVPTGFRDLDDLLSGLQPQSLVVLGARPAMGKSALALGIAANVAREAMRPVLFFALEMGKFELTQRLVSSFGRVDAKRLKTGRLDDRDWQRITDAVSRLAEAPLYIDDDPGATMLEIRAKARRLKARQGDLGLVVVDYLQLMTGRTSAENRQVEVAEISRGLKLLARELECPVIALSQLSRKVEDRSDKRPMLSDLRESGSIEQDSDVVMFIHREELVDPDTPDKGLAEIMVAKHRNGPTGRVTLAFLEHFTLFADLAREG